MKTLKYLVIIIVVSFLGVKYSNAQQSDSLRNNNTVKDTAIKVEITLKDGTVLKGNILAIDLKEVVLKTAYAGIIHIDQSNIALITNVENAEFNKVNTKPNIDDYSDYNPNNPNNLPIIKFGGSSSSSNNRRKMLYDPFVASHKYCFSNSYEGVKKKELLYQNIWVMYSGMDYGINDNISIGGGVLYLLVTGFANLHLRGQYEINEFLKIGGAYNLFYTYGTGFSSSRNSESLSYGLLTGGVTIGTKSNNVTFSIGQGSAQNATLSSTNISNLNSPGFSISGMAQLNKSVSIMTDNFFVSDTDKKFFSLCFRLAGKNNSVDLGLMANTYKEDYYNYSPSGSYSEQREAFIAYPFLAYVHTIK